MKITIETEVEAPLPEVWSAWVGPDHITGWNFAIDEWCCPSAELDLSVGGRFSYRMEAKDGSVGFDFEGTFTQLAIEKLIHFELDDGRPVSVEFVQIKNGIRVIEPFEAEDENSAEQQKQGWQSILNNFKKYVDSKRGFA